MGFMGSFKEGTAICSLLRTELHSVAQVSTLNVERVSLSSVYFACKCLAERRYAPLTLSKCFINGRARGFHVHICRESVHTLLGLCWWSKQLRSVDVILFTVPCVQSPNIAIILPREAETVFLTKFSNLKVKTSSSPTTKFVYGIGTGIWYGDFVEEIWKCDSCK